MQQAFKALSHGVQRLKDTGVQLIFPAKDSDGELDNEPMFDYRHTIVTGIIVLLLSFGGFFVWMSVAPLTSAAIAPGIVKVMGERQSVQHLEGGIIRELFVEEGSTVTQGQVLLRLDPTQRKATRELLEGRLVNLEATAARLHAERDGLTSLIFPDSLIERATVFANTDILGGERITFESRLDAKLGQEKILQQRMERFRDEVTAYKAQRRASQQELGYINEELEAATIIYEKGIYEKPKYLALKRSVARLEGQIGEFSALVARTHQRIGETELEVIDLNNQWVSKAAQTLQSVSGNIMDIKEQMEGAEDVLSRLEIRAPQAGVVVGLKFHTVGGVLAPGAHVLDIVPANAALIVEARVRSDDIDVVGAGLDCDVQLSAYSRRSTPPIPGKVLQVSADSFVDEISQQSYYRTIIELDADALAAVANVALYPGMPAEVFIKTGKRTALEYLLEPITRTLNRSLRE